MHHDPSTSPNLFLVGAPKCGTTSLYEYLRQHPEIFFPASDHGYGREKEPQHFCPDLELSDKYAIHDRDEYLALYNGTGNATWRGDASTYNLYSEAAPGLIRQFCPQARILIMLRSPIEMIHSYHSELLRWGQEDIAGFAEAIEAIEDRKHGRRLPKNPGVAKCLDYINVCRLAPQVARYLDMFGRDAVKVILLEDMIVSPVESYRSILRFLAVDDSFQPEFRVYNETPRKGILERSATWLYTKPGIQQLSRTLFPYSVRRNFLSRLRRHSGSHSKASLLDQQLRTLYKPDIERLAALIDRDLSHWL